MRVFLTILIVVAALHINGIDVQSQHFIGMHKDKIIGEMKDSQKNFKLNTSTVNPYYNYLKYEDRINEITILYFLSDDDECTLVRKMYAYSNIIDVEKELNARYERVGKNKWEYRFLLQKFSVELSEEEWFFTVTIKRKN